MLWEPLERLSKSQTEFNLQTTLLQYWHLAISCLPRIHVPELHDAFSKYPKALLSRSCCTCFILLHLASSCFILLHLILLSSRQSAQQRIPFVITLNKCRQHPPTWMKYDENRLLLNAANMQLWFYVITYDADCVQWNERRANSHAYCYNADALLFLWFWVRLLRHLRHLRQVTPCDTGWTFVIFCRLTSSAPRLAGLLPLLNEDKALRHRLLLEVIRCMGLPEAGLPGTATLVYTTHGM